MPQSRRLALLNAARLLRKDGQGRAPQAQRPRVRDLRRRGLLVRAAARVGAKQREQLRWGVWTDDKWQVANSESFELSLLVFGQYNPSVFLDARADLFVQAKLVSNIVDLGQEENGDCIEPGRDPN